MNDLRVSTVIDLISFSNVNFFMLSAGFNNLRVGNSDSSTPMNSANLYWIPSLIPDTAKRIFPLSCFAASAKILE
jgi:hypothetical protein